MQPVGAHAERRGRQLDEVGPELRRPLGAVDGGEAAEQVGPPALDPGAEHDLTVAAEPLGHGEGGRWHRCSHARILADLRNRFHTLTVHADAGHRSRTGNVPEVVSMTMSSETSTGAFGTLAPAAHGRRRRHGAARPAPRPGAAVVARRQRRGRLAGAARGDGPVGEGRRHPGPHLGLRRPDVDRPAHRPDRVGAAAHPGVPHGARAVGRAGLGPGRARPHPPPGRLHVVQPDARRTSCSSPSATRRPPSEGIVRHLRRPRAQLPGHAARRSPAPPPWSWSSSPR